MYKKLKGMSLVECLVALVILTIATLIIYMGFTISANYTKRGSDIRRASEAAVNLMEDRISDASKANGTGPIDTDRTVVYEDAEVRILDGGTPVAKATGRYIVVAVPFENIENDETLGAKDVRYTAFVQDKSKPKEGG